MEKKTSTKFLATLLCIAVLGIMAGGDDSIAKKCSSEFAKVSQCVPFATGKAAAPTKDCCGSVTDLKNTNPACLCYIIQQVHNGTSDAVKSLGVQESRLLQLPSACKLANASVTECPKLLKLPPNSPDAAIFTNISATASPDASSSTTPSNGYWIKPQLSRPIVVAMAISLYVTGLTKTYELFMGFFLFLALMA